MKFRLFKRKEKPEGIIERIDDVRQYFYDVISNCFNYTLHAARYSRPLRCLRCGWIFAEPLEGFTGDIRCPHCGSDEVVPAEEKDVLRYAESRCSKLYGRQIAILALLMAVAEEMCGEGESECDFRDVSLDLVVRRGETTLSFRYPSIEVNRLDVVVRGVDAGTLRLIADAVRAVRRVKGELQSNNIDYIVFLTFFSHTALNSTVLLREGFLDLDYFYELIRRRGVDLYGLPRRVGALVKIYDIALERFITLEDLVRT